MRRRWMTPLPILVMLLLFGTACAQVQPTPLAPEVERYRPTEMPDRIVLSWTGDPARSAAVNWRTAPTVESSVAQITVAQPASALEQNAQTVKATTTQLTTDLWPASYHSVTFAGLTPETVYDYRVGDGAHWSEWLQFRTASAQPRPLTFIWFGDTQSRTWTHWPRVLREALRAAPDAEFLAFAGDLVDDPRMDVLWGDWFAAGGWIFGQVPVLPTPGNHEYQREPPAPRGLHQSWRAQFALPENWPAGMEESVYYVDCQGLRFISLNPNESLTVQRDWLDHVLANNPNRWTVIEFHQPIFSSAKGRDNPEERATWKPLFDRYGVDLVLSGHDHTYARTGLFGSTIYVVSVSGVKMYDLQRETWMRRAAEDTQLFQVIRIDGDKLAYEARTATGQLYDAFELKKRVGNTNQLIELPPTGVPERRRQPAK